VFARQLFDQLFILLVTFEIVSWVTILLFYTSQCLTLAMTGTHHHAQILVEMGSCELFAWAGLKTPSS
jgi:hypothetical protein